MPPRACSDDKQLEGRAKLGRAASFCISFSTMRNKSTMRTVLSRILLCALVWSISSARSQETAALAAKTIADQDYCLSVQSRAVASLLAK